MNRFHRPTHANGEGLMSQSLDSLFWFVAGALLSAALLWPQRRSIRRWWRERRGPTRVQIEDALKYLYFCEAEGERPALAGLAGRLQISEDSAALLMETLQTHALVELSEETPTLTPDGRAYALHIVRAHRLWERYLADKTGYAAHQWHARAERAEHDLTGDAIDALESRLNFPLHDPHGDPIPTASGDLPESAGQLLTTFAPGAFVRVLHVEDEPATLYAQLAAAGFYPGLTLQVLEQSATCLRVWADGAERFLAPIVAGLVTAEALPRPARVPAGRTLADLALGEAGRVEGLSPLCRGAERGRILDLGFVPGTQVTAELGSAGGDPIAYRVRGALIALRHEQARLISIAPAVSRRDASPRAPSGGGDRTASGSRAKRMTV